MNTDKYVSTSNEDQQRDVFSFLNEATNYNEIIDEVNSADDESGS